MNEDTIVIGGVEFPKGCPTNCPGRKEKPPLQGGLCYAYPYFNCLPGPDGFVLLRPEDYRHDWAIAWKEWFDNGMKGFPKLYLSSENSAERMR